MSSQFKTQEEILQNLLEGLTVEGQEVVILIEVVDDTSTGDNTDNGANDYAEIAEENPIATLTNGGDVETVDAEPSIESTENDTSEEEEDVQSLDDEDETYGSYLDGQMKEWIMEDLGCDAAFVEENYISLSIEFLRRVAESQHESREETSNAIDDDSEQSPGHGFQPTR